MKNQLSKLIQYVLFPILGISIIWWLFKDQKIANIIDVLKNDMNFYWIGASMFLGVLSHMSRAARWQQLIGATDKKPGFNNSFWSVMVGYFVNLLVPRMGEVSKCGVLSKYENVSFTKVVGTVVVERLCDLIMLILLLIVVLSLQFDLLGGFLTNELDFNRIGHVFLSPVTYIVVILILAFAYIVHRKKHSIKLFHRFSSLWEKFKEGFTSIRRVKNIPLFIFHTLFIWLMYFGMVYVCFFSLDATSHLTVAAGITILLTGSLGMLAPVQGGLGTWHAMVIATLGLYNIDHEIAGIFSLVVHAAQNVMIIITGLLAFIVLPITNRSVKMVQTEKDVQKVA